MGISITEQLTVFLYSLSVGAFICVLYDLFRILRMMFGAGKILLFLEDLLFCLLATGIIIIFLFYANSGEIRWFAMAGAFIGFFVYYNTISRFIIFLLMKLIRLVKRVLMFIFKITIMPIIKLIKLIAGFIKKIILKINGNIKFLVNHFKYKLIRYRINIKARRGFNLYK
ncbi:MAG: spore cortex biosynthesis protein YabQ [Eubacteriales bacterium]